MFESLSASLSAALTSLRGRGRLTDANMREGLEAVRTALLEADVAYDVADGFLDRVAAGAAGARVLESLDPTQQLVGIVHHELVGLMGPVDHTIPFVPGRPTVLMLCGLQGSGKTTSCAKLAKRIKEQGRGVLLVAADLSAPRRSSSSPSSAASSSCRSTSPRGAVPIRSPSARPVSPVPSARGTPS